MGGGMGPDMGGMGGNAQPEENAGPDNVVDADFEVVDDEENK